MMKTTFLLLILLLTGLFSPVQAQTLTAHYRITTIDNQTGEVAAESTLELWRTQQRVAHYYPQTQITEGWERVGPNRIKATRYFDQHQRAIEYPPGEVVHGKTETDWSARNQLIADSFLSTMKKIKNDNKGHVTTYRLNTPTQSIELSWLAQAKLVEEFKIVKPKVTQVWKLISLDTCSQGELVKVSCQRVEEFFALRDDYQSTDYADIGDDHTDPFLNHMVHLGFIEHGASGFYQAQPHAHPHH